MPTRIVGAAATALFGLASGARFRPQILWAEQAARPGAPLIWKLPGSGESYMTDCALWLQEMTAEAECMAHTAPSVIAGRVRGSSGWVEGLEPCCLPGVYEE